MPTGAITQHIDVAQVALYLFWIFFAALIVYLHKENKREGYPLETDQPNRPARGLFSMPTPKVFKLAGGEERVVPVPFSVEKISAAQPVARHPGAALEPTGNPMLDGVGPGSYSNRPNRPDRLDDGSARIVPMRDAPEFHLETKDPDPRGMSVLGCDRQVAGTVTDVWVDKAEIVVRYLEVAVKSGGSTRQVLLPMNYCRIKGSRRQVKVASIRGDQFAKVPATAAANRVTLLEEEKITAYYGAGHLYATPDRLGPVM